MTIEGTPYSKGDKRREGRSDNSYGEGYDRIFKKKKKKKDKKKRSQQCQD